jgi:hypothetical protein
LLFCTDSLEPPWHSAGREARDRPHGQEQAAEAGAEKAVGEVGDRVRLAEPVVDDPFIDLVEAGRALRILPLADADEIAERVTNALGVDALVGIDRVGVSVGGNDVTLTGTVRSEAHRAIAVTTAARIPGVAHVHDHLSVNRQS